MDAAPALSPAVQALIPRASLTLALCALAVGCGPAPADRSGKPAAQPAARAERAAAPKARKCPDPDNRDAKDPCSASYIAPYKPAFKRDRF